MLVPNGIDGHRPTLLGTYFIRWLRPEYQNPTKASDGHRPTTSRPLRHGDRLFLFQSKIQNQQSSIDPSSSPWPDRLPDQVAIIRKLINSGDRNVAAAHDAEALSALSGHKNKKRTDQIEGVLKTLKGLGQL
jgi:hypothetical protein